MEDSRVIAQQNHISNFSEKIGLHYTDENINLIVTYVKVSPIDNLGTLI